MSKAFGSVRAGVIPLLAAGLLTACDSSEILSTDDEAVPVSLSIVPASLPDGRSLFVGESATLQAELRDGRGRLINGRSIKWSSSDPGVASVDGHGALRAVGAGAALIEASHRDLSASVEVTVVDVATLELSPTSAELRVGETLDLTVSAVGTDGLPVDASRLRWSSSKVAVASVETGRVTAQGGGSAVVAVDAGSLRAESAIVVTVDDGGGSGQTTEWGRTVKFFVGASSGFDQWTRSPSLEEQAWMREHYFRMMTYSSYFDSRLSWYPNAWVYRDAYAVYRDSDLLTQHPDWLLRDADGNLLYIPYGCSGGTCPQYAADFGNPEYRAYWIERVGRVIEEGYIGVGIDDVNMLWRVGDGNGDRVYPHDPRTGTTMTLSDWRRYMAEFMEEVRAAFADKEIVHNAIWYADPDDPYVQRQMAAADFINLERGATDRGIRGGDGRYGYETFLAYIDRVHALGGFVVMNDDDSDTDAEWIYELANYLLVKTGDDMLGANGVKTRISPDGFWDGYLIDLGEPLGERYVRDGLFRRDYRCGSAVLNQPDQPTRTVELGETFQVLGSGERVSSVTLDAYRATVLLRENCTP